jgi:hypothetical protein
MRLSQASMTALDIGALSLGLGNRYWLCSALLRAFLKTSDFRGSAAY